MRKPNLTLLLVLGACLGLSACETQIDLPDAALPLDASRVDVSSSDAFNRVDGASPDGGLADGGLADGGPDDGGLVDSGPADGGTDDASMSDGGPPPAPRDTVEIVAGNTATGFLDGVGVDARFSGPSGAVLSPDSNTLYIADTFNALLRAVDLRTGVSRTLLGRLQVQTVVDGVGAAVRFQSPRSMAITPDGTTLYLADGPTLRRITLASLEVTTVAGTAGMAGYMDGTGAEVRLGFLLHSMTMSADGNTLYIADRSNRVLRTFTPATGEIRTVAGTRYTGDTVSVDGVGAVARFSGLGGILRIGNTLYVCDTFNHTLRQVDLSTFEVRTVAGQAGTAGIEDGPASEATFDAPQSLTTDGTHLYITSFQGLLRRVRLDSFAVNTVLGEVDETTPRDGVGDDVRLGVAFGPPLYDMSRSQLLFNDRTASSVRTIDLTTRTVSTLAGAMEPIGSGDGPGSSARFNGADDLLADGNTLYIADGSNAVVRAFDRVTRMVRTVAGVAGEPGFADGPLASARLGSPSGLAIDGRRLFVADAGRHTVRVIDLASGMVSTLAGDPAQPAGFADGVGSAARLSSPRGLAVVGGILYVADSGNRRVRAIDLTTGAVSTPFGSGTAGGMDASGTAAQFRAPTGLLHDAANTRLFVADATANTLRAINLSTGAVSTYAGLDNTRGQATGAVGDARFNGPRFMVWNSARTAILVSDQSNHMIRRIDLGTNEVSDYLGLFQRQGSLVPGRLFPWSEVSTYFPRGLALVDGDVYYIADNALHIARPMIAP